MVKKLILKGLTIHGENESFTDKELIIEDDLIKLITDKNSFSQDDADVYSFPEDYHLVPGFIDLHVHGIAGYDVMDATQEALNVICNALASEGTTSFLATTMTADNVDIEKAISAVKKFKETENTGAEIIGLHLEGPFLSKSKMGAQRGDKITLPDVALIKKWETLSDNLLKQVTLAPELKNSHELINYLTQKNIIASIGHTNATYEEAIKAIELGCSHATHLFNAMSGIHHRNPGAVTAALLSSKILVELIVDGLHLHPAIVELVLKIKGYDQVILVTDAMRAKCMPEGQYDLGGQTVFVKNEKAELSNGMLAGSLLTLPAAISNTMQFSHCHLRDALKMVSVNPAKALGLYEKKGSIALNKEADLVVLDSKLKVVMTIKKGRVVFCHPDLPPSSRE